MKIGYVIGPNTALSGSSNGIRSQALIWKKGMEHLGHDIDLIDCWGDYRWEQYDLIHIFGRGLWLIDFVPALAKKNPNIVFSPIIDSIQKPFYYKLSTLLGIEKLRIYSLTYGVKRILKHFKGVFVRSDYEGHYLTYALGLPKEKLFKVPISISSDIQAANYSKEDFCLHVSSIYQGRKNVIRLVQAAKKYDFKLVLAGSTGNEKEFLPLKKEINNASNIKVLGFVSDDELVDLYKRAKVFALPSICEGVGIVALDAAAYGCEIVITKIGGPKEYYNGLAEVVNPYSVDEIGTAVTKLLNGKGNQPELRNFVLNNNSSHETILALNKTYSTICCN